ncbi:MAG: site-specific integrase [Gammaproteobacteria bacterium]
MARPMASTYVQESLAPSTQAAYAADLKRFLDWGGAVPAPPELVANYLAAHASQLKVSTLTRHLASIVRAHSVKGLPSPSQSPLVRSTVRGIRRVHGSSIKQAKPLTLGIVRKLAAPVPDLGRLRNVRDRALLLVGFAGGFRRSEITGLMTSDLAFSRRGVVIRLRASKTDPSRQGRDVALPYTQSASCPVRALKTWLRASKAEPEKSLPLFRRIDRYGHLHKAALCGASVGWILRQRMQASGIDHEGYSAHSLRAGFVTSAAKAGTPIWAIQRQTGHRSEHMVHCYIRGIGLFEHNATATLMASA